MLFDRGIYVIRCGRNYKIGVARDIYQRISQFMIGNPIEMEVLIFAKVADAMSTESELHGMYSDARVSGEWFNLKPEDVNDIAKHIGTETISILSSSKEEIKNYRPIQSKDEIEYLAKKEEEYAKSKEANVLPMSQGVVISKVNAKGKFEVYVASWKRIIKVKSMDFFPEPGTRVQISWYEDRTQPRWKERMVFNVKEENGNSESTPSAHP